MAIGNPRKDKQAKEQGGGRDPSQGGNPQGRPEDRERGRMPGQQGMERERQGQRDPTKQGGFGSRRQDPDQEEE